ncbi:hypothetical protein [Rhodococcus sp. JVH1]|uniref:hypothetical protein n=1 Tax=Rhodococcus sp. JVH1 TaxID=745408 RepID=UPI001ED94261|nr:hypothetical protein [Rhodococcus sp. JVH1]
MFDLAFFPEAFAFGAGGFLLFLHLHHVVRGQFELTDPQGVIGVGDAHFHHVAELGDR